ncbi:lysine N(6)-hydroxylase/L-ornithine N(5)-oxygenase family protein [Kutzneria kofuensis]|uniref:L-lysine N6-monooxygenase MbtG n=1 Tax=Kutzneria kofuensis TaxID=103725 RepID=A0A7W9KPB9_9PSEU|nr:SidA/IucD/PvdA family monooxygenase [Kutzneria kofuensis]MBB5896252.1 lysine N6-hydroxylase [Kutzneria kofuensis]
MADITTDDNGVRYHCVGIGVGPANLSLASLLHSHPKISNLFLERKANFGWHDGQLVAGAALQVPLLKDLVTLSDPTNAFSFLAYLHAQGRIYHFVNSQFDAIPRQEFRNYLEWASRNNKNLAFGETVREVAFDGMFHVRTSRRTVLAENVAVGVGQRPWVPEHGAARLGPTQFHVHDYVDRAADVAGKRVAVVGGGQSGAEAVLDLLSRPGAMPRQVCWVSRRQNYFPIDDSPFTNDYYMPCHSDYFARLDLAARADFNAGQVLTSDGISLSTLRALYQRIYLLRFVAGAEGLAVLRPNREVVGLDGGPGAWRLTLRHNHHPGAPERIGADVVVWATGYRPEPMDFLAPLASRLEREHDEYRIDDSFAVRWDGPIDRNIFMQNSSRRQRGLAERNLSLIAWRSQRIIDRLRGVRTDDQQHSFIDWSVVPDDPMSGAR